MALRDRGCSAGRAHRRVNCGLLDPRSRAITRVGRRRLDAGQVRKGTRCHHSGSRGGVRGGLIPAPRTDGRRRGFDGRRGLSGSSRRKIGRRSCCGPLLHRCRFRGRRPGGRSDRDSAGRPVGHGFLGRGRHRCSGRRRRRFGRRSAGRHGRGAVRGRRRGTGRGSRRRLDDGNVRRRRLGRDGRGRARLGHRRARGQEPQRIEIPLRLGGDPHAEVHVRLRHLRVGADADRPDAGAFGDRGAARDRDRAEVRQRHGVPVGGCDRDAVSGRRDGAREGDVPGCWSVHRRAEVIAHVDPTVLARRVRMRGIEEEGLQHGARGRPRPGPADGHEHERDEDRREELTTHRDRLSRPWLHVLSLHRAVLRNESFAPRCCPRSERSITVGPGAQCCQMRLQSCHREPR